MLAGIIYGLHDYRLGEAEMPKIEKSTDVLLKVTATAICTSEVHYAEGFQPLTAPFTTGHGFVGTIVEAGSDPTWGNLNGGMAEYVRVPFADQACLLIPEGVPDEQALLVGDMMGTGYQGVVQAQIKEAK